MMISFILNEKLVETNKPAGTTLLDFIRYEADLKGTKIGCREGDCGACTVLAGTLIGPKIRYRTIVSCLTPLGNIHGKHIVTVEGINMAHLSPVQEALVEHNGTQCGFCTPGFVMSLTAFLLSEDGCSVKDAIAAIDGNICRCTGYKSIEKAAAQIAEIKSEIDISKKMTRLIEKGYLPSYFKTIPKALEKIEDVNTDQNNKGHLIGGGTDLMVQRPDELTGQKIKILVHDQELKGIKVKDGYCMLGAETSATEIMESAVLQKHFPRLSNHFKLISSTPIRNMGTIAGNIVNASPIGDLSILFLALNADIFLKTNYGNKRKLALKDFFLGYKKLAKTENEIIEHIGFFLPDEESFFNFEKVSKRQYLDIASVNSAIGFKLSDGKLKNVHLSAGGVSPVPLYLKKTSAYLVDNEINIETIITANTIAQEEISPIGDIRGSVEYKRLLLRQLIFSHFIELFPNEISINLLLQQNLLI
jgi:xanthine dehydrogenase small subunit